METASLAIYVAWIFVLGGGGVLVGICWPLMSVSRPH